MVIFLLAFLLCIFQVNYSMELSPDESDIENNNIVIEPLISDELLEKENEFSDAELELIYQSWREETSSNLGENALDHYHNIKIRLGLCEKGSVTTDNIQPPQDQIIEKIIKELKKGSATTDNIQPPRNQTIEKIIKELISGTVNSRERINKRGDTIFHVLCRHINPLSAEQIHQIKLFLLYGANSRKKNKQQETPYKILKSKNIKLKDKWSELSQDVYPGWEENHGYLPLCISHRYRYANEYERNGKIVMCVIHGTGFVENQGPLNKDYYDLGSEGFPGFIRFAENYANTYNQNHRKKKTIHLIVFKWSGSLFDLMRASAGKDLVAFLNSWDYRNDKYVIAAHSHGCNVTNFALKKLAELQKNKLCRKNKKIEEHNKNKDKSQHKPYVGIADLLLYFAPPCKQKYPDNDKNYDIVGKFLFDPINNKIVANEPTSYNQLVVFYSKKDSVVTYGVIDGYTIATGIGITAIAAGGSYYLYKKAKNNSSSESETKIRITPSQLKKLLTLSKEVAIHALPTVYAFCASLKAGFKKTYYAHNYHDIVPKNIMIPGKEASYEVRGPKSHVQILVDGKKIEHSSTPLLKNHHLLWEILTKEYPGYLACSGYFVANIDTRKETDEDKRILCFLETFKNKDDKDYFGCDQNRYELVDKKENIYLLKTLSRMTNNPINSLNEEKREVHDVYKSVYEKLNYPPEKQSHCTIS